MTTDITELTPEAARESGSILIIVAARMARREFFTPLHALCESGQRVVSTRALCDAVERVEEHMVSQVSKIVDGHDRLTKKLKEAESRNAELLEALEKAQTINAAAEKLVRCKGRYHSELNYRALASLFGVNTPDLPPLDGESRTVTVKPMRPGHITVGGEKLGIYMRDEVDEFLAALTAAGIKWEAE